DESYAFRGSKKWQALQYSKPVSKNTWYSAQFWVDVPFNGLDKVQGKYNVAIKPSNLTVIESVSQNKIVILDPWYDSAWGYRKEFTVTGSTAGAQTNYQMNINVYYGNGPDSPGLAREPSSGTYTAGATTNSTRIVCASLTSAVDDYYNGATVYNVTRSASAIVTDYVGATKIITCTAIAAQQNGDAFQIVGYPTIYLNSKCQTDFDDVRFTKSDGVTLLSHWSGVYTISGNAYVWVKIDVIPASPTTTSFYIYYGNVSATSASSGADTFIQFDNFEDAATWSAHLTDVGAVTKTRDLAVFKHGVASLKLVDDNAGVGEGVEWAFGTSVTKSRLIFWSRPEQTNQQVNFIGGEGASTGAFTLFRPTATIGYYDGAYSDLRAYAATTWYKLELRYDTNADTYDIYIDDVLWEKGAAFQNARTYFDNLRTASTAAGIPVWYMDTMLLTKYCNPEPLVTSWGEIETTGGVASTLIVSNAKVFSSYINDGDWFITCLYTNLYEPYYSNGSSASELFYIQLYDGANVIAQTKCAAWGYKPGSIYLSAAMVAPLTWGQAYQVRLYGNFTGNPTASYTLVASDWKGTDLSLLDSWARSATVLLEDYYGATLSAYVSGKGLCLNDEGSVVFTTGCPTLDSVRPNLFQTVSSTPKYIEGSFTQGYQSELVWQTSLGSTLTGIFTNLGGMFSLSGAVIGMILAFIFYAVIVAVAFTPGNAIAAIIIPLPVMLAAWYVGVIALVVMGVVCAFATVLLIWYTWLRNA
ncbi:MAG: DUF2341 domain-containing protein, partial [Gammaproteobacteria bacterium]|nr:DUF2341 domain-containing protein [Gammaproteobacteria bacterium]